MSVPSFLRLYLLKILLSVSPPFFFLLLFTTFGTLRLTIVNRYIPLETEPNSDVVFREEYLFANDVE